MVKYFFYFQNSFDRNLSELTLNSRYRFEFWKPKITSIIPSGLPLFPFGVWWIMHYLRIFKNNNYGIFLVYDGDILVHRSGVFPGYFRFPFMSQDDIQIGDIWTHPEYRRQGIASFAIQQILILKNKPGRIFWYIVESNNLTSIKVIEKLGFKKIGEGVKRKRFGFGLFGTFIIEKKY